MDDLNLNFSIDGPIVAVSQEPDMPNSFEEATKEEISEVLQQFRARAKDEAAQKAKNVSTDYWVAVYFASQEQRDAFLVAINALQHLEDQYLAGSTLARLLNVEIPKEEITVPKAFRRPANIDDLVLEM